MHYASIHGHACCAAALCGAGADRDAVDADGMSAFRYALRCDHLRVVVVLLRAGVEGVFPETDADPHRLGYNAAALPLARSVRRAGSWRAYSGHVQRLLIGIVSKCRPVPDCVAGIVVGFWCPPGHLFERLASPLNHDVNTPGWPLPEDTSIGEFLAGYGPHMQ